MWNRNSHCSCYEPFLGDGRALGQGGEEKDEPLKVVHQVFQSDFGADAHRADGSEERALSGRHLMRKHIFDARTYAGPAPIHRLLLCRERRVPIPFPMNP